MTLSSLDKRVLGTKKMDRFVSKITKKDASLLGNFELLLSETELEIRGGNVYTQFQLIKSRYRIQKKATLYLGNVEVAIYGSIYGSYDAKDKTRLGVYI